MSDAQNRPLFRMMAAQVERGGRRTELGNFSEVGAVWAPNAAKDKKWCPVNFNIVPSGLGHGHVRIFLAPVGDDPIVSDAPDGMPMYRIMAAPVTDQRDGSLGAFHSVGAVWSPKADGGKWAPFNMDLVPMGLDRGAVKLFLMPVTEASAKAKAA